MADRHGQAGGAGRGAGVPQLRRRAAALEIVRTYFRRAGFLEVETPALVRGTGQDEHLELFETAYVEGPQCQAGVLITSPELHMKRLLGAGLERIFQLCRCFRNGERSARHMPEFTMLEWYCAGASCRDVVDQAEALVHYVVRRIHDDSRLTYQGRCLDLSPPWPRISVRDAFGASTGIDLRACPTASALYQACRQRGLDSVMAADSWEDGFMKLLVERVEPWLGGFDAVALTDYPAPLAALARLREDDPATAERAEIYVAGMELANGFGELTDPVEQRRRFLQQRQRRRAAGRPLHPVDEAFLAMLERGMPPAAGMALGIDRLVMLLCDAGSIDEVLAFPFPS